MHHRGEDGRSADFQSGPLPSTTGQGCPSGRRDCRTLSHKHLKAFPKFLGRAGVLVCSRAAGSRAALVTHPSTYPLLLAWTGGAKPVGCPVEADAAVKALEVLDADGPKPVRTGPSARVGRARPALIVPKWPKQPQPPQDHP